MMKTLKAGKSLEAGINALLVSNALNPGHKVIVEYTLVKLVQCIRSNTCEYIGVWKIGPEGMVTGPKTVICE